MIDGNPHPGLRGSGPWRSCRPGRRWSAIEVLARADVVADRLLFIGATVAVVDRAKVVLELSERRVPIAQHDAGEHSTFVIRGIVRRRHWRTGGICQPV
jgi:hypothetical protein